jgi:hypothetical protein
LRRPFDYDIRALVVVIGPVTWLGLGLIDGLKTLIERLDSGQLSIPPPWDTVRNWPLVANVVGRGSRHKHLDARHLIISARNHSNRPVDRRGSARRVELDHDSDGPHWPSR